MQRIRSSALAAFGAGLVMLLTAGHAEAQISIYSSVPLKGENASSGRALLNAERLALKQSGGKAGAFAVKLVALDDATKSSGTYDPNRCSSNPFKATQDDAAVAYLGDFDSRCDMISASVTNESGLAQISPAATLGALTKPGTQYRVTGTRTYLRVIGSDDLEATAIVRELKNRKVKRVYVLGNGDPYGDFIRDAVITKARNAGIKVVGHRDYVGGTFANATARQVLRSKAQVAVFGGVGSRGGAFLLNALGRLAPKVKTIVSDRVADARFGRRITATARERATIMFPAVTASRLGTAKARNFASAYKSAYGSTPDRYAAYGYEAMKLALSAIVRAGANGASRDAVRQQLFATKDRDSVLGKFSIQSDGDTTRGVFGTYKFDKSGQQRLSRVITVG